MEGTVSQNLSILCYIQEKSRTLASGLTATASLQGAEDFNFIFYIFLCLVRVANVNAREKIAVWKRETFVSFCQSMNHFSLIKSRISQPLKSDGILAAKL